MLSEKYRPKKLDEVVGQDEVVSKIKNILSSGDIPHLMFIGGAGTGKTTVAMCIAREIYGDEWESRFIELNASDERGIDVVRNKIKKATQAKGSRIIFLDEADSLTMDAQQALRRIMEKSKNATIIMSCNYEHKIIAPIKSRCAVFTFKPIPEREILKRLLYICKSEGISLELTKETKEGLEYIAKSSRGDMRYAINTLEKTISNGKITKETVIQISDINMVKNSIDVAFSGDFDKAREMIEEAYLLGGSSYEVIIQDIIRVLENIPEKHIKIKLFEKLAEIEYRCRIGSDPVIQLVGFIAYCWIVRHVKE